MVPEVSTARTVSSHRASCTHFSAFWDFFAEKEAETIWNYKHKFDELDLAKGKEGHELDELNAHRFLEVRMSNVWLLVQGLSSQCGIE